MNAFKVEIRIITLVLCLGALALVIHFEEARAADPTRVETHPKSSLKVADPIELGPSARAYCSRQRSSDKQYSDCVNASRLMGLMNSETRDKKWADRMEADLSDWVESSASKGITSREIECRLSWCLVEVGSSRGELLEMDFPDQNKKRIFRRLALYAPDVDDQNIVDVVFIFQRFCRSPMEIIDRFGKLQPDADAAGTRC